MTRYWPILFLFVFGNHALGQTQWHLENYLLRIGAQPNGELGEAVKGVGDYDHDGAIEVAVAHFPYTEIWSITSHTDTVPKTRFRGVILEKGDINGDGFMDFVISKPVHFGPGAIMDTVFLYFGNAEGIDTIPDLMLLGENLDDGFGSSVAIGDLNGDGVDDLVVGAREYPADVLWGKVYIYYGRSAFRSTPDCTITGDTLAGIAKECHIGDVNGDGKKDLLVAGFNTNPRQQRETWLHYVNVYYGGASFDTVADLRINGFAGAEAGGALAVMDANGDGQADILWARQESTGPINLQIYYGGTSLDTIPDFTISAPPFMSFEHGPITDVGDMDGDGYHDIGISSPASFQESGFVMIYRGGPGIDTVWDGGAGQSRGGAFGYSVDAVGDINGDNLGDIIVGEYMYSFGTNKGAFSIYLGNNRINAVKEIANVPLPQVAHLEQNYPNPFNPSTKISYTIAQAGKVSLQVYDLLGRLVTTLAEGQKPPGEYSAEWSAPQRSAGVYFCRLTVSIGVGNLFTETKKIILLQ